jgi:hypothetical protein
MSKNCTSFISELLAIVEEPKTEPKTEPTGWECPFCQK